MAIQKLGENRWRVRVDTERSASGERTRHDKVIHGTKKEAEAYERKVRLAVDTGEWREPSDDSIGEYLDKWFRDVATPRMKPASVDLTAEKMRLYIKPTLGKRSLEKLTTPDVRALYNDLLARGLSVATVRRVHGILRSAFEQAVDDRILRENPAARVKLPTAPKKEMRALRPEEAQKFLYAAACDKFSALWPLLLATGMRPGEALALRWQDVDLKAGVVIVRRSLTWRPKGVYVFTTTKTDGSYPVPVPPEVTADLKSHRVSQAEARLKAGGAWREPDLIFTNDAGVPLNKVTLSRHLKIILKAAGLPKEIRVYDLRHSCATLLLADGIHPKVVAERLGHANVALTLNTYSHVTPGMQAQATEALGKRLFPQAQ